MRLSAFLLGFLVVFLFSTTNFSQASLSVKTGGETIWEKRAAQMKADILDDVENLPAKEQARYYGRFGKVFLSKDKKEAALWIGKALEIAFNPATEYKDNKEKAEIVRSILVFYEVLENEDALFKKPLAEIVKILNQEVNEKRSDEYGEILITLANQLLKKDENLATELAILSVKGNKPAYNWDSFLFLEASKKKNAALSEKYFAKAIEAAKTSGRAEDLSGLFLISFEYYDLNSPPRGKPQNISEAQKKELLELLVPHIQKESAELLQKKRDNCLLTKIYGKRFLDDYKKLLPPSAVFVEQALSVCQSAAIDFWRKPDFEAQTSQDFLNLAKQIGDKQNRIIQTLYAASRAGHDERNYRLAVEILDGIDEDSRKLTPLITRWWESERLQSSSELLRSLLNQGKFAEVRLLVDNSPANLRPFIVIRSMNLLTYFSKNKQILLELLDQAKTELFAMEIPSLRDSNFLSHLVLGSVHYLIKYYYELGAQNELIGIHEEYLEFFTRVNKRRSSEIGEDSPYSFYYSQTLSNKLIETHFERIFQNIRNLESSRYRLNSLLNLFQDVKNNIQFFPNPKPVGAQTIQPDK